MGSAPGCQMTSPYNQKGSEIVISSKNQKENQQGTMK